MECCLTLNKISRMLALKKIVTEPLQMMSFKATRILEHMMKGRLHPSPWYWQNKLISHASLASQQ